MGGIAYGTSDDVGDVHQVVIYNIGKVIRRESIALDEDKVLLVLLLLVPPVDPVHKRGRDSSPEAYYVRLSPRSPVGRLLGGDVTAGAWVPRRLVMRRGVLLMLLEV